MVGLMEDVRRVITPGFKKEGDVIALLGTTQDDLENSEYAVSVGGVTTAEIVANGVVPKLDLKQELAVQQTTLEAAEAGLLTSAHDCADGGLAVALAELCFSSLGRDAIGAEVELKGALSPTALLFSESPSRIVISFEPAGMESIRQIAAAHNVPFEILGAVSGTQLKIRFAGNELIQAEVAELESTWRNALYRSLKAEAIVAG
jgi:phosphoribosylformylglycinamidine synthase